MGAETYKRIKVSALGSAPSVMTNTEVDRAITRSPILFQTFRVIAVLLVIPPIVASCASHQIGPYRAIPIESDVEAVRSLAYPSNLANSDPGARNDMLTARIYMSDMEYQVYEANLTKEMQDEGLLGTAAVLGLTTSSTLVGAVATKTILSGIATGVTGLDKAYNEKELLSNAMQALQTQMRADRNAEAAQIYAKMFRDAGNIRKPTPISEYTMAMALSDAEAYYQAGTITSALIGLSRTAARADANAAMAKANAGPNPSQVAAAQETAAPTSGSDIPPPPPTIIIKANSQVPVITPPPPVIGAGNPTEKQLGPAFVTKVQNLLCVSGTKGAWDGPTHDAIKAFFAGVDGVPWSDGGITPGSANPHSDLSEKGITLGDAGDLTHASSILAANPQLGSCKDLKGPELDNWRRKLGGKL